VGDFSSFVIFLFEKLEGGTTEDVYLYLAKGATSWLPSISALRSFKERWPAPFENSGGTSPGTDIIWIYIK